MRIKVWFPSVAPASLCVALLAGCTGGSATTAYPLAPNTGPLALDAARRVPPRSISKAARERPAVAGARAAAHTWSSRTITQDVFLADAANGVVDIFDFQSKQQSGQIAGLSTPEGLATDAAANLYVADTLAQTIEIFAKPYSGTPTVLNDNGYFPVGVHVDERGNVYVANICSGSGSSCSGDGNTIVYAAGSGTPKTLPGGPARAYFVTTDAHGNVWVDGESSGVSPTPEIGYFPARNEKFKPVPINFVFPGSIAFDRRGNLLLDDQGGAPNGASILYVYPPGATSPSGSIALQTDGDDIIDVALGHAEARLFAPGYFSGTASIITYPDGLTVDSLTPSTLGALEAVAVVPGTRP